MMNKDHSEKYLVLDIENDTANSGFKRNAGNFLFDNIVMIGFKRPKQTATYSEDVINQLGVELNNTTTRIVVGHNLKHDLLFLLSAESLRAWLENGGEIWDTQLAEYYLTSFQHSYPALRDIAVNKYNCLPREKKMELYWEQGKQTSEIPKELVIEDVTADVSDTESIYLKQIERAQQLGIFEVLTAQMNALLATVEMEYNGFYVDAHVLHRNKEELITKLTPIKIRHDEIVSKYMDVELYTAQPKKGLHTLFFGGTLEKVEKAVELDADGVPKIYKSGNNKGQVRLFNKKTLLNITGFGVKAIDEWKTEKGNISIDESVLKNIILAVETSHKHKDLLEFCKLMLDIRDLEKQISTYYESVQDLIYPDSRIRGKFHHCKTITGRLSSSDPNLQNIPRGGTSKAKEHFTTRYSHE